MVARLAARGQGVRVLYTMHGSLWGTGVRGWQRAFFTGIERALGRGTDFVFTVNAEDADDCVRRARLPGEQVVTLPAGGAGVAPEFFQDEDASNVLRRRARKQVGLEPNLLVVGYVGRTVAANGPTARELEMLVTFTEPASPIQVCVVGPGSVASL